MKVSHFSDIEFPQIGAGTYEIRRSEVINCALRLGYKIFDLAESYGNLKALKNTFRVAFLPISEDGLGIDRTSLFITMKVFQIDN